MSVGACFFFCEKILSLEQGKQYKDVLELRNGLVIVMVDQDHKGAYIKGFQEQEFYSLPEFNQWKD